MTSTGFKHWDKRWRWISLGLSSILVRFVLGFFPELVESLYTRGLYQLFRVLWDHSIALSPIPLVYILFFALLFWLFITIQKRKKHATVLAWFKSFALSFFAFAGGFIFLFLLLWGFNYGRVPIETQLDLAEPNMTFDELIEDFDASTQKIIAFRQMIPEVDTNALDASFMPPSLEEETRANVEAILGQLGFPTYGRVRGREINPKGVLLRISTAGIYIPFVAEGHIDNGLHPLQKPFTLAHEMMHGYGFTDEGTCNFLAYLACQLSEKPLIQYAGELGYWRYLAFSYRRQEEMSYLDKRKKLPIGIRNDLYSIYVNGQNYPDILPSFRDAAYDSFLKSQGVEEGLNSYNKIVKLVRAYRHREKTK